MKKHTFDFTMKVTLKESDIAIIGVVVTIVLYVMNVFGTGIIVGGDVGHIGTGIPLYGFFAPVIFTAFAVFAGYYTKRYSMNKVFKAIYITLLVPFASYLLAAIGFYLPFMFLCMPVGSLFYYLQDGVCELLGYASYELPEWFLLLIFAVLILPLVVAPVVYRFTQKQEN